ncbi:Hybrid signal transduction histidine kinase K [Pseudocercospora fuligena]|uniref:histidine kinase n=1 Tax=Pseudocercospora fuligena TaxID=685502 RepID=A0A8H6R9D8_9PEZI|nr:Hybrid signal transduction histidine kinase K [Pseudocercospora fuligena]
MTCHEIRNPLGAVVHCADLVRSSLMDLTDAIETESRADHTHLRELVDSAVEAINIVFSCCAHQKRIVDDILTLSKLDSKLVSIAPAPVKLNDILNELFRTFEADSRKADVDLRFIKETSLSLIATEWVALDAGRLMQVLINLITNALKFTQKESERTIKLTVGASRHKPAEQDLVVEFTASNIARDPVEPNGHFGNGEQIYLHFSVRDTGCGFDEEQKGRIFKRFSQASPRTHTKYGGSGLGLFISREMIELQGGEIGVASTPGKGATFAFYIASQIADVPKTEQDVAHHKRTNTKTSISGLPKYNILVVEDNLVSKMTLSPP